MTNVCQTKCFLATNGTAVLVSAFNDLAGQCVIELTRSMSDKAILRGGKDANQTATFLPVGLPSSLICRSLSSASDGDYYFLLIESGPGDYLLFVSSDLVLFKSLGLPISSYKTSIKDPVQEALSGSSNPSRLTLAHIRKDKVALLVEGPMPSISDGTPSTTPYKIHAYEVRIPPNRPPDLPFHHTASWRVLSSSDTTRIHDAVNLRRSHQYQPETSSNPSEWRGEQASPQPYVSGAWSTYDRLRLPQSLLTCPGKAFDTEGETEECSVVPPGVTIDDQDESTGAIFGLMDIWYDSTAAKMLRCCGRPIAQSPQRQSIASPRSIVDPAYARLTMALLKPTSPYRPLFGLLECLRDRSLIAKAHSLHSEFFEIWECFDDSLACSTTNLLTVLLTCHQLRQSVRLLSDLLLGVSSINNISSKPNGLLAWRIDNMFRHGSTESDPKNRGIRDTKYNTERTDLIDEVERSLINKALADLQSLPAVWTNVVKLCSTIASLPSSTWSPDAPSFSEDSQSSVTLDDPSPPRTINPPEWMNLHHSEITRVLSEFGKVHDASLNRISFDVVRGWLGQATRLLHSYGDVASEPLFAWVIQTLRLLQEVNGNDQWPNDNEMTPPNAMLHPPARCDPPLRHRHDHNLHSRATSCTSQSLE